jgi:clan AA aspartic protease (TIGR02281 family)
MSVLLKDDTPNSVGRRLVMFGAAASVGAWYFWPQIYPLLPRWLRRKIVRIKADIHGSFYVNGTANNVTTEFLVDTGCDTTAFPRGMIASLGLNERELDFNIDITTANGHTKSAPFALRELVIAGETFRNIKAEIDMGDLDSPLLGNSFLCKLPGVILEGEYHTLQLA